MDGITTAWVVQNVILLVIGGGIFLMKRSIGEIDKKIDKNAKRTETLEKELSQFKLDVSNDYVKKDDFNATTGQIMSKLDKIMDLIIGIKSKEREE